MISLKEILQSVGSSLEEASKASQAYKAANSFLTTVSVKNEDCLSVETALLKWLQLYIYKEKKQASNFRKLAGRLMYLLVRLGLVDEDQCKSWIQSLDKHLEKIEESLKPLEAEQNGEHFVNAKKLCMKLIEDRRNVGEADRQLVDIVLFALFNGGIAIEDAVIAQRPDYQATTPPNQVSYIIAENDSVPKQQYVFRRLQWTQREAARNNDVKQDIYNLTTNSLFRKTRYPFGISNLPMEAWIEAALDCGLTDPEIRAITKNIPAHYSYLESVEPITDEVRIIELRDKVANSLLNCEEKWFIVRLIRQTGVTLSRHKNAADSDKNTENKKEETPVRRGYSYSAYRLGQIFGTDKCYYPYKLVVVLTPKGKKKKVEEPVVAEYMFIKLSQHELPEAITQLQQYGRFMRERGGKSQYSAVPLNQMLAFQKQLGDETKYHSAESLNLDEYKIGDIVNLKLMGNCQFRIVKLTHNKSGKVLKTLELEYVNPKSKDEYKPITADRASVIKP